MIEERIQAPEGVKKLMQELWLKHHTCEESGAGHIYWVDLSEPTGEEKHVMAANRANSKPVNLNESKLQTLLYNSIDKLGGW